MGFFDSVKSMADKAKDKVSQQMDAKAERDRIKNEAKEAAQAKAKEAGDTLSSKILSSKSESGGYFSGIDKNKWLSFTKDYFQKLVMPACSVNNAKMLMYPYTDDNVSKRNLGKMFADFDSNETIIFTLNIKQTKEYIALTDSFLYCKIKLENSDVPAFYQIKITVSDITEIEFGVDDKNAVFSANNTQIVSTDYDTMKSEQINLNYYFQCIKNQDFTIIDDEIDEIIHKKVGDAVYSNARKYMDEDDKIIYFAWGLDSVTAKDFLMCTQRQFVMLNRELMGATQDVKRFYYEDITSMSVQQNEQTLTGTLLNAALKLCNLIIFVAGTRLVIQTLSTPEAERVIEIYTKYKAEIRKAASQPQKVVIDGAVTAESPIEQIKKLNELKELGIISEEEFNQKKADLLSKM